MFTYDYFFCSVWVILRELYQLSPVKHYQLTSFDPNLVLRICSISYEPTMKFIYMIYEMCNDFVIKWKKSDCVKTKTLIGEHLPSAPSP